VADRYIRGLSRGGVDDFEAQVQLFNAMLRSGELEPVQLEILAALNDPVALTLIERPIERPLNFHRLNFHSPHAQGEDLRSWLRQIQLEGSEPWWIDLAIAVTRLAVLDDLENSVDYLNLPDTPENALAINDYERIAGDLGRRVVRIPQLLTLFRRKVRRVSESRVNALTVWHELARLLISEADPANDVTARAGALKLNSILRKAYGPLSVSRSPGLRGRRLHAWLRRGVREICREWWGLPGEPE